MMPEQNQWICSSCGRKFTREQVASAGTQPDCHFCGAGHPLRPWMEKPNWFFVLLGWGLFPVVGRLTVYLGGLVGLTSPTAVQVCFFAIPALLGVLNLLAYFNGRASGNRLLQRGGEQMLLMLFGFGILVVAVALLGYYPKLIGLEVKP